MPTLPALPLCKLQQLWKDVFCLGIVGGHPLQQVHNDPIESHVESTETPAISFPESITLRFIGLLTCTTT